MEYENKNIKNMKYEISSLFFEKSKIADSSNYGKKLIPHKIFI